MIMENIKITMMRTRTTTFVSLFISFLEFKSRFGIKHLYQDNQMESRFRNWNQTHMKLESESRHNFILESELELESDYSQWNQN